MRGAALALAALLSLGARSDERTDFDACAARALPARSMHQVQDVRVVSDSGWTRASRREVWWQRAEDGTTRVLFAVEQPKAEAGLKLLVVQKPGADPVINVYSPDLGRARRVVGNGASSSVLGTDFTFEDALYLERFLGPDATRVVRAGELDGHPAIVAESRPDADDSAYALIRTYLDTASCLPLRSEFIGANGAALKTLVIDPAEVRAVAGRPVPFVMTMTNHARHEYTEIRAAKVELDIDLPSGLFTLAEIEKSH